jgi:fructose-specific phosphotransferase system IIA component
MINPKLININMKADSKNEVISKLIYLLEKDGRLLDKEQFTKDVMEREDSMSTNMGAMIAIPHAKSKAVRKSSVVFAHLESPVEWHEEGKVDLVFLLAINEAQHNVSHLETIATLATYLVDDDFKKALYDIKDAASIVKLIENYKGEEL